MKTDPGAPVSAVAVPVKSMPSPSPRTQTPRAQKNDTTSAGRTVRRKSSPVPMHNWIRAKNVFQTAMWGLRKWPMWVRNQEIGAGCPLALARMKLCTKPWPNM